MRFDTFRLCGRTCQILGMKLVVIVSNNVMIRNIDTNSYPVEHIVVLNVFHDVPSIEILSELIYIYISQDQRMVFVNAIELKFFNVSCCGNCITTDYACISLEIRKLSLLDVILTTHC